MNVSISTQLQSILSKTSYVLQNERQERSSDDSPVSVGEEAVARFVQGTAQEKWDPDLGWRCIEAMFFARSRSRPFQTACARPVHLLKI